MNSEQNPNKDAIAYKFQTHIKGIDLSLKGISGEGYRNAIWLFHGVRIGNYISFPDESLYYPEFDLVK